MQFTEGKRRKYSPDDKEKISMGLDLPLALVTYFSAFFFNLNGIYVSF